MFTIYTREIKGFFSSLTGYVVMIVFLLLTSLFMWVFSGQMNILDNGYASLDTLFSLAPWVFLFLVPAISMRMFAEEKHSGTLELLFTRPVREFEIVSAKFAAAWTLVILSIVPTLLFFISVYFLGSPKGNLDIGGIWGSYIGLVFLGGIYAAIGIFSSSLTENQIVAFIIAVLLSFLFYLGFSFISSIASSEGLAIIIYISFIGLVFWGAIYPAIGVFSSSLVEKKIIAIILAVLFSFLSYWGFIFISSIISYGEWTSIIEKLGIDYHYQSASRGVIDSRDIAYFLSVIFLFLFLTKIRLQSRKW